MQGGSLTVTPTISSAYTVAGVSASGCNSQNTVVCNVTVWPLPTITVNNGTICSGGNFVITPSGANTYTYSGGSATVSPVNSTSYSITGSSSLGCVASNTAICNVNVFSLPVLVQWANDSSVCAGEPVLLNVAGASTYTWDGGATANSLTATPFTTTTYSVSGTDANGCVNQASLQINVDPCTGIVESTWGKFYRISPNPNKGRFEIISDREVVLFIYNELGQVIKQINLHKNAIVNIEDLAKGIYFVKDRENLITTKILVTN